MSNIKETVDQVKIMAGKFKAIGELCDLLENIGDLDAATKESARRKTEAEAEQKDAEDKLNFATTALNNAQSSLDAMKKKGDEIIAEANKEADGIVAQAKQKAQGLMDEARKMIDDKKAAGAMMEGELKLLASEIDDKKAELKNLNEKIAATKEQVLKFISQ